MGQPFSSVQLVIEDTLRVLVIIAYIGITAAAISLAVNPKRRYFAPATLWGLMTVIVLGTMTSGTELLRIGHTIFEGGYWWRLPLSIVGVFVSFKTVQAVSTYPTEPPKKNPWR